MMGLIVGCQMERLLQRKLASSNSQTATRYSWGSQLRHTKRACLRACEHLLQPPPSSGAGCSKRWHNPGRPHGGFLQPPLQNGGGVCSQLRSRHSNKAPQSAP